MTMNSESAINAAKQELANDINFNNAPATEKVIAAVTKAILAEVAKATITVPAQGLVAPPNGGPVTGNAQGKIS